MSRGQAFEAKHDRISYCRLEMACQPGTKRLGPHIRDPATRALLNECFRQAGALRKLGRAPRGGLERKLESWLETRAFLVAPRRQAMYSLAFAAGGDGGRLSSFVGRREGASDVSGRA